MADDGFTTDRLGLAGDDVYEMLMAAHEGLSEAQSHALNARLVLLMANHIGDKDALKHLIAAAKTKNSQQH